MQTKGGILAQVEVFLLKFRPNKVPSHVDFLGSCACLLTGTHHGLHLLATGWKLGTHGKLLLGVHGGILVQALHEIALEKILRIIWGTWESNPGPSACKTRLQPTEPWCAFVIWMDNKYYIKKQTLWCKTRAKFKPSNHALTPIIFFVSPVNIKQDSGGFKPPQTKTVNNSD